MDRVLSARVDEDLVGKIGTLARELHTTRKSIIEGAIRMFAEKVERERSVDILDSSCGTWERDEAPQQTLDRARKAFTDSVERHHR